MIMSSSELRTNPEYKESNKSFENVVKFMYLGTTLANLNYVHNEIKCKLNSGNACCPSVQYPFLPSHIRRYKD
jgi:hypothetical protein